MGTTSIQWCDKVWNPVTGCRPGKQCWDRCYARRMANRLRGRAGYPTDDPFRVTLHHDRLDEPLHWRKPSRIFVCSMGEWMFAPWPYLDRMLFRMERCPQHTFLTLTKEPWALWQYLTKRWRQRLPANLWLGLSAEYQRLADDRVPFFLSCAEFTPRLFVSHEPALGPIDYRDWLKRGIQWLISGGESGPRARPCDLAWLRADRDQARAAGCKFFMKQMGARPFDSFYRAGVADQRVYPTHPSGADPAEWPADLQNCREVPSP